MSKMLERTRPGQYTDTPMLLALHLRAQRLHHAHHRELGGGVHAQRARHDAGGRRSGHDVPALTMRQQARQEGAHAVEDAVDVHVQRPVPVLPGDTFDSNAGMPTPALFTTRCTLPNTRCTSSAPRAACRRGRWCRGGWHAAPGLLLREGSQRGIAVGLALVGEARTSHAGRRQHAGGCRGRCRWNHRSRRLVLPLTSASGLCTFNIGTGIPVSPAGAANRLRRSLTRHPAGNLTALLRGVPLPMFDPKSLLDQFLGGNAAAARRASRATRSRIAVLGPEFLRRRRRAGRRARPAAGQQAGAQDGGWCDGLRRRGRAGRAGAARAYQNYQQGKAGAARCAGSAGRGCRRSRPRSCRMPCPRPDGSPFELLLLRAMIGAAKSDGQVDGTEQQHLFEQVETPWAGRRVKGGGVRPAGEATGPCPAWMRPSATRRSARKSTWPRGSPPTATIPGNAPIWMRWRPACSCPRRCARTWTASFPPPDRPRVAARARCLLESRPVAGVVQW